MRYLPVVVVISLSSFGYAVAADPPDPLAAKKEAWQKSLERNRFRFSESDCGIMFSLSQYGGDCKFHMIRDPKKYGLTLKFEREGKEILVIDGHTGSAFRAVGNVLYLAEFCSSATGCIVSAHDLTTGKKLWETKLKALGVLAHRGYRNEVTMGLSSHTDLDKDGEGIVSITARETFGDYVEILDRASGKLLAHKVYRNSLDASK